MAVFDLELDKPFVWSNTMTLLRMTILVTLNTGVFTYNDNTYNLVYFTLLYFTYM